MSQSNYPHRPPRLDEVFANYDCPLFFITFNTAYRREILATDEVHRAFQQYCQQGVDKKAVVVGRFVIMPDHIHLFVHPISIKLGEWIKGLKRVISLAVVSEANNESHWQPGFFDHLLRSDENYAEKWDYVRLNPVRAGLVSSAEEWPFQGEIVRIDRL